jgi:hypothetical protein
MTKAEQYQISKTARAYAKVWLKKHPEVLELLQKKLNERSN